MSQKSNVKKWNTNFSNKNSDITNIYHQEVENMIREQIWPNEKDSIIKMGQLDAVLRRGPGSSAKNLPYANGIHSDYGMDP